jgi:hypothetical protein
MAFEQVRVRLGDGQEFGPVAWSAMLQWHQEGRVPADAHLVDHVTGEARPRTVCGTEYAAGYHSRVGILIRTSGVQVQYGSGDRRLCPVCHHQRRGE